MPRHAAVGDPTFMDFQHAQLEQGDHIAVDPKVIGCEMSHERDLKALQFARWVTGAVVVNDGCLDRFDRRCTQCPTAAKAPAHRGWSVSCLRLLPEPAEPFAAELKRLCPTDLAEKTFCVVSPSCGLAVHQVDS